MGKLSPFSEGFLFALHLLRQARYFFLLKVCFRFVSFRPPRFTFRSPTDYLFTQYRKRPSPR